MNSAKWPHRAILVALLLVPLGPLAASAAPEAITLPGDYADFALHPETGDLAALDAEQGQAVLFRRADLEARRSEPAATLRVGATPCAIVYKQFEDQRVFAVVCSQDSHLFLINAADFTLVKKIALNVTGVSHVAASLNPDDPFVYYNHGGGHESAAGVVSLRDLRNHGAAFGDSMDCAVSASGEVAYRRGPWSPSGFESLLRTNRLDEAKPTFARLFYDHNSTAPYVPDPFDRFTAAGSQVFTRSLESRVAELDFAPQCFFRTRPVVVGVVNAGLPDFGQGQEGTLMLRAASYNTFSSVGEAVSLSRPAANGPAELIRGILGQGDFKRLLKRTRLFADDPRQRVVAAERSRVFLIPLAEFDLPDEPLLLATLKGPAAAVMGRENRFTLQRMDDQVEIAVEDMPEGMELQGDSLVWTPTAEQIGEATVAVTFKHQELQRTLTYDLEVVYPHTQLPFTPADFATDADGKRAVLWEGMRTDQYGQLAQPASAASSIRLAVVEIATGKILAERKVAGQIGSGQVAGEHLVILSSGGSPKCEVLRLDTLERAKTLVARAPIDRAHVLGQLLVLQTQTGLEVYDRESWEQVRVFDLEPPQGWYGAGPAPSPVTEHGLLVRGVLYGPDLQPKLISAPGDLPTLGAEAGGHSPLTMYLTPSAAALAIPGLLYNAENPSGSAAGVKLPGVDIHVKADLRTQQVPVAGAIHTARTLMELSLTASGAVDARQVLVRKHLLTPAHGDFSTLPSLLKAAPKQAIVVYQDQLYRWQVPPPEGEPASPKPLTLVPQQSALTIDGQGQTILEHQTQGGRKPIRFSLLTPYDGVTIDEDTGAVTLDEAVLMAAAMNALEQHVHARNGGELLTETLRAQAPAMIERTTALLGRRPQGAPVAIPIRVDASDARLENASLHYFLVAEAPSAELLARLRKRDEERRQSMQEAIPAAPVAAPSDAPAGDDAARELAQMRQRMDALEQRLDLITRQLNTLAEKLEERK